MLVMHWVYSVSSRSALVSRESWGGRVFPLLLNEWLKSQTSTHVHLLACSVHLLACSVHSLTLSILSTRWLILSTRWLVLSTLHTSASSVDSLTLTIHMLACSVQFVLSTHWLALSAFHPLNSFCRLFYSFPPLADLFCPLFGSFFFTAQWRFLSTWWVSFFTCCLLLLFAVRVNQELLPNDTLSTTSLDWRLWCSGSQ